MSVKPALMTNATTASFTFAAGETSTYECQLDGGTWTACTSPKDFSGLAEGSHTFNVRATDQAGNPEATAVTYTWMIDTTSPVTTANPAEGTYDSVQNVILSANEPAKIFYTTNGTDATESSLVYSAPIPITVTTTLKFFAEDPAGNAEAVKTAVYRIARIGKGDINGDGSVDLTDAVLAMQVFSDVSHAQIIHKDADVDGDGKIGLPEVIYILQFIAGMRHSTINSDLIADFRFDGNPEDSTGTSGPIFLQNTEYMNDHLYLNGTYGVGFYGSSDNGYTAVARISNFQYETFTVSTDFYALKWGGEFPNDASNILTGGTSYRWLSLNWSDGKLLLTLNNWGFSHLFDNTNLSENKWHNVICSFDLNNKIVITSLDGVILDRINLDDDFTLEILGSEAVDRDKEFTFTNYSNGDVFDGYVDNLKVYNRAFSESEILDLYSATH